MPREMKNVMSGIVSKNSSLERLSTKEMLPNKQENSRVTDFLITD